MISLQLPTASGGQWHRPQCFARWESLSSRRAAAAPLVRAATHDRGYFEFKYDRGQIFNASHMLESYDVLSTVIVQWDVTTLPDEQCAAVGAFPLHCFDAPEVYQGAFVGLHITDADIARLACASKEHQYRVTAFKQQFHRGPVPKGAATVALHRR